MKSNYRRIGDYIREVKIRNKDLSITDLRGINIDKYFMPSVANTIGTDMSKYKVVQKGQFACNRMHVGRDKRLPIALHKENESIIVSPAYTVFEIIDHSVLDAEYLMMWFSRSEFDREAWFYTDSDVRGGLSLEDFLNIKIPLIPIEKQREIVKEYNTILNRIKLNENVIEKLEDLAQSIYKQWFVNFDFPNSKDEFVYNELLEYDIPYGWNVDIISNIISVKDGTHDSPKPVNVGFPLVTSTHLNLYDLSLNKTYNISKEDFDKINKRSKVDKHDILFSMIGTVGLISYILYDEVNFAVKNVGLFKTSEKKEIAEYILFYLKSDYMKKYLEASLSGSTQSYVTLSFLREIPIVVPPREILHQFKKNIDPLIKNISCKVKENILLDILVDSLSKRMSSL